MRPNETARPPGFLGDGWVNRLSLQNRGRTLKMVDSPSSATADVEADAGVARPVPTAQPFAKLSLVLLGAIVAGFVGIGLAGLDFGRHWDEAMMQTNPVRDMVDTGTLLPKEFFYPTLNLWINMASALPETAAGLRRRAARVRSRTSPMAPRLPRSRPSPSLKAAGTCFGCGSFTSCSLH